MAELLVEDLVVEFVSPGDYVVRALDGLTAHVPDGQLALLLGPSGSGKTTLMSVLGGILRPTSGAVRVDGLDLARLDEAALVQHRRQRVGFVFQAFNLIASLTALDNVAAPLLATGTSRREARRRAAELLERVGLSDRARHRPAELSGGQQQRVAVARGLVRDPTMLLADEPTANLDYVQAEEVIRLLRDLARPGRVVVVATHDDRLLPIGDVAVDLAPAVDDPASGAERVLEPGEDLFVQGSRSGLVHVVESGAIGLVRVHADGSEESLAVRGPGEYLGELGPMMGQPRSATARALEPSVVRGLTLQEFRGARR